MSPRNYLQLNSTTLYPWSMEELIIPSITTLLSFYIGADSNSFEIILNAMSQAIRHHSPLFLLKGYLHVILFYRFAPPGSYLNARKYHPYKLAAIMATLYKRRSKYYDFFRWHNHYYYVDTSNVTSMVACRLCAKLNKIRRNQNKGQKSYKRFRRWWNENFQSRCAELRKRTTTTTVKPENLSLSTMPSFRYVDFLF